MAYSPASNVQEILVTASVGINGVGVWSIKVGRLVEDGHDAQIGVFDSPGEAPDPKWLLDYPRFQVIVRGAKNDYDGAWKKAKDVKDALVGIAPTNINGDRFDGILGVGDIAFLKYDENDRPLFSMNFRAFYEPGAGSLTNRQPL